MTAIEYFFILIDINSTKLIMEEYFLNYSPTLMFRGTPCMA